MEENIEDRYKLTPDTESLYKSFKEFLYDPIKKGSDYNNLKLFRAFCKIFYTNVQTTKDPEQSWVEVYEAIGTLIGKKDIEEYRSVIKKTANNFSIYNKLKRGKWKKLLERRPGRDALYRPRFIKIVNPDPKKPTDYINGLDTDRERAEAKYARLIKIISKKLEPKEEILHLTHITKPSGLIIPKTEQELRNCFDTLRDFQIEVVPREDARFLAELFKKKDFHIVVEGPPMTGKSTFAYLVSKAWLGNAGIVSQKLDVADLEFIRRENFLVIVDAGAYIPFDLDMYSMVQNARKLLIVRRVGEPKDLEVRDAIDNLLYDEDFFEGGGIKPTGKIRCELGKMGDILGVVNAIEKAAKIKVDDEVKKEICAICVSYEGKHTILGFAKAIFIGLASLRSRGEVGDPVTIEDFKRIRALELKEYKASEKELRDIYDWLDHDIQNFLKAFRFLDVFAWGTFGKLVVEEAYRVYNGEELQDRTIEKAEFLGLIHITDGGYIPWHIWQVEIVELKKEIKPLLDELIPKLRRILPYDEDRRITLSLAHLLWSTCGFEKSGPKKRTLWEESMKYFRECMAFDPIQEEAEMQFAIRVRIVMDEADPNSLYPDILPSFIGIRSKVFLLSYVCETLEKNDQIEVWLDFASDVTIKQTDPIYLVACLRGILKNRKLTFEAKKSLFYKLNNIIALKTPKESIIIYASYVDFIGTISLSKLSSKEKECLFETIINLSKKRFKKVGYLFGICLVKFFREDINPEEFMKVLIKRNGYLLETLTVVEEYILLEHPTELNLIPKILVNFPKEIINLLVGRNVGGIVKIAKSDEILKEKIDVINKIKGIIHSILTEDSFNLFISDVISELKSENIENLEDIIGLLQER